MNIVFFSHPLFLGSESMPRFSRMLLEGMEKRGWNVTLLRPDAMLARLPAPRLIRKWLGYFDQYVIFPMVARLKIKRCSPDTLFVFTDHALGPWVPLVSDRAHVIHCHDFLAQKSAKGMISENPTSFSGRCYQAYIRRGYRQGQNFISVSIKTQEDLAGFLGRPPRYSTVVYNGLNRSMEPHDPIVSRTMIGKYAGLDLSNGYLLHVGGNQWYKNRPGVIDIYDAWRRLSEGTLPLIMIGKHPDGKLDRRRRASPFQKDIHFITGVSDDLISFAYSGAALLLFPSLAEGFGWPIAEAMACGCPVVTTDGRPMTEVAGGAAFLIPIIDTPNGIGRVDVDKGARLIRTVLELTVDERRKVVAAGLANAKRFNTGSSLDKIDSIYRSVLLSYIGNEMTRHQIDHSRLEEISGPAIRAKI